MSNLYPTTKSLPCPVCEDVKGNCRHSLDDEDFQLCHTFVDARKGERINGFVCVKQSDGHTASFKPDNTQEWTEDQRLQWDHERRQRCERSEREKQQKLAQLLPVADRDQQYRQIVATQGLSQKHRISELFKKRGLNSEEIDFAVSQEWLFSSKPGVKVDASPFLAGVIGGVEGTILGGVPGIGISYLNCSGEVTGFQILADDREKYGSYPWLSSAKKGGNGPHLPSGELPIAVWKHPEAEHITETWLVEGGLKSLISALKLWFRYGRRDILVIGSSGGDWAGSIGAVVEGLGQTSKVVLCPDAGSLDNSHILSNYKKIIEELTTRAYSISVAWWGQFQKGKHCDIDEIDNTLGFNLITPEEFFNLQGKEITFCSPKAVNPEALKNWLNWNEYTADIEQNEKFFKLPDNLPKSGAIIAIKSTTGTGKTHDILKAIKERESEGIGTKFVSPRIKLNLQLTQRAEKDFDLKIYLLNEDSGIDLLMDSRIHQSLCPESLHKIDGFFTGSDLVIDEAVGVISQILNGGTLQGKNQALALKVFKKAFNECNNILLLDANLNDQLVDLVNKLAGNKQSIKIANIYQHEHPQPAIIVDGIDVKENIKIHDKSALVSKVLKAKKPCIGTDSQIFAQSLAYLLIDAGKSGFVLDSKANEENWLQLFERSPELENRYADKLFGLGINPLDFWADRLMKNPDKFFLEFHPDFFIFTPTAESGVSIDLRNFFTCKFLVFFGVIGTDSQIQMSQRLRDTSIPTYIYCPEKSVIPRNSSFNQQTPDLMRVALEESLQMWDSNNPDFQKVLDFCKARLDENKEWWDYGKNLTAIQNFEFVNLRSCLSYKLRLMGYTVEVQELEINEDIKRDLKDAKEMLLNTEAELIYNSQAFESKEEADRIAKRKSDAPTLRRVKKTYILHAHPGLEQSKVLSADYILNCYILDDDFIRSLNNFYLLSNPEIAAIKADYDHYFKITEQFVSQKSLVKDTHKLVFGLRELGVLELIELLKSGSEFTKDSEIIKLILSTNRTRKDLKCIPGLKPPRATTQGKETMPYIKLLLSKVGINLKFLGKRKDEDGVRKPFYCLDTAKFDHPYRTVTLDCIQRYFENWKVEKYEVNTPDWAYSAVNNGERKPSIKDSENPDIYLAQQPESIIQNVERTTNLEESTCVVRSDAPKATAFDKAKEIACDSSLPNVVRWDASTIVINAATVCADQAKEIACACLQVNVLAIAKEIFELEDVLKVKVSQKSCQASKHDTNHRNINKSF